MEITPETPRVRSIVFDIPRWGGHLAGQHVDVRLTAPDGYQAQRSYSIASPPEAGERVALTVERLDDGEVSLYLVDDLQSGDRIELRGPIGGYFTWAIGDGGPLFLVAGGSGIVPLMAMLRHRRRALPHVDAQLLYSVRSPEDVFYRDELGDEATLTFTRRTPPGWAGATGRIDIGMINRLASSDGIAYVCGPHGFVETAAQLLMQAGYGTERIRTERFGPS